MDAREWAYVLSDAQDVPRLTEADAKELAHILMNMAEQIDELEDKLNARKKSNVVNLPVVTTLDIPAERVLASALEADLKQAVVIGNTDDEFYFASTVADGGSVLWLMEKARLALMGVDVEAV